MKTSAAVAALAALAQETRLEIFRLLVRQGPAGLPAGRIGERLGIPPATLSFHLAQLRQAGLLRARRQGREIYQAPDYGLMGALVAYLTENCCRPDGTCAPAPPAAPLAGERPTKGKR